MSSDPTGRRTNSGAVAPNEESKRTTAGTVSEDSASNRNAVPRTSPHLDFQPPLSQGRRSPLFRSYNAASGRDTSTAAVASRTRPKQTQSCESTPSRGNLSQPPTTFGSARRVRINKRLEWLRCVVRILYCECLSPFQLIMSMDPKTAALGGAGWKRIRSEHCGVDFPHTIPSLCYVLVSRLRLCFLALLIQCFLHRRYT